MTQRRYLTPLLSDVERPVVGKWYMVPCVKLSGDRHSSADSEGWAPVIGPEHEDRDIIGFQPMHIHVDARFVLKPGVNKAAYRRPGHDAEQSLLAFPVSTHSDGKSVWSPLQLEHSLRRKKCVREMPAWPAHRTTWMPQLEQAYAGCKLKPGLICPHRGIPLAQFVTPDGTVECPGHGLRWDVATGELLPRTPVKEAA